MAVPEHHIRESVARYLSDAMSLVDFQTWFVPRAWEILETESPAAPIASHIELLLAEYTNGDLSEDDLREALTPFGSVAVLDAASVPVSWYVATSASAASVRLHDVVQEHGWWRVTPEREVQAA